MFGDLAAEAGIYEFELYPYAHIAAFFDDYHRRYPRDGLLADMACLYRYASGGDPQQRRWRAEP